MNRIKQKLRSKGGMTILIALVGFLVAAMVSIVIVTAAVTSSQRVANDTKETQAHLTLESAAQIVQKGMENTEISRTVNAEGTTIKTEPLPAEEGNKYSEMFGSEMVTAVNYVETNSSDYTSSESKSITISLKGSSTIKPVKVTYTMKSAGEAKYRVIFMLTLDDDTSDNVLYLTMQGSCQELSDSSFYYHWDTMGIDQLGDSNA